MNGTGSMLLNVADVVFFVYIYVESLRNAILESGTKTERSKSYDEGLDNYREEGRGSVSCKSAGS